MGSESLKLNCGSIVVTETKFVEAPKLKSSGYVLIYQDKKESQKRKLREKKCEEIFNFYKNWWEEKVQDYDTWNRGG